MTQFAATLRTLALVAAFAAGVVLQAEVGIISTPAPVSPAEQARMLAVAAEAFRLHQAAIEANRGRLEELTVITGAAPPNVSREEENRTPRPKSARNVP